MHHTGIKSATPVNQLQGVCVTLDALVRAQFRTRDVGFLPRQPVHSILNGRYASRLRGRGLNFEELRGYLPGDDPRTIDWKVTARTRKPYVRVYSEERDRPMILLVDQRNSMFFGSKLNMKSVSAAESAAIAAWRSLAMGDRVGAVIFNDQKLQVYKPLRSRQRVTQILAGIANMNRELLSQSSSESDATILNRALTRALRLAGHDALVCLVSDGFGVNERSRSIITRINAHNDVINVFIYDPLEVELPETGDLRFSDGRFQLGIGTQDHNTREVFKQQFTDREAQLKSLSLAHSIPFIPLSAARTTAEQIRESLGRHGQRSGRKQ